MRTRSLALTIESNRQPRCAPVKNQNHHAKAHRCERASENNAHQVRTRERGRRVPVNLEWGLRSP